MSPEPVPAIKFSIVQLSEIMTACFQQYIVPLAITAEYFAARFTSEGINFNESVVWMQGEKPVAIALVTTRNHLARIAAFALHPECRGKGLAKPMMAALLSRLAHKKIRQVALEVIGGNVAASALYQAQGFQIKQTLLGFSGQHSSDHPTQQLQLASVDGLHRAIYSAPREELPWQLDPVSFPALPCEVVRDSEHAWAVIDWLTETPQLRYLFVDPACRHQGLGSALLSKISARYPGVRTPVAVPERLAPLFSRAGYQQIALRQYEMGLSLPRRVVSV